MKSPRQIAAEAVQDELYARAAFERLIKLPAAQFRSAVEADPRARTEAMARLILDYCEESYLWMPPGDGLELMQAADVAAANGEPHLRVRVAKDFANTFRYLGRYPDAEAALRCADSLTGRTFATGIHRAVVEFARLALDDDIDKNGGEHLTERMEIIIRIFEENRAPDRAYQVRLYDAFMKYRRGEHLPSMAECQDAVTRALNFGSEEDLALAYYNLGHSLRALGDFGDARTHFIESAGLYREGIPELAAKSLRCAARMTIRMFGYDARGVDEIADVKRTFLTLNMSGEVCRSTLAIMEELFARDPQTDLNELCREIEDEMLTFGVPSATREAVHRLTDAARNRCVTEQALQNAWNAFGPSHSLGCISGVATVRN